MPRPDDESCGNCRFWEEFSGLNKKLAKAGQDGDVGTCRRYPLAITNKGARLDGDEILRSWGNAQWPRVRIAGWCGEWKSIVTEQTINEVRSWVGNETPVAD